MQCCCLQPSPCAELSYRILAFTVEYDIAASPWRIWSHVSDVGTGQFFVPFDLFSGLLYGVLYDKSTAGRNSGACALEYWTHHEQTCVHFLAKAVDTPMPLIDWYKPMYCVIGIKTWKLIIDDNVSIGPFRPFVVMGRVTPKI